MLVCISSNTILSLSSTSWLSLSLSLDMLVGCKFQFPTALRRNECENVSVRVHWSMLTWPWWWHCAWCDAKYQRRRRLKICKYPSFVQAWACLKLVSRAKQSLPVISLEIPVRPSWTKIKPSEIWRKCNQRRREPANLYQCRKDDWTTSKATPGKIGHEWKPKSSQQQRSAIIVKKQEEANIERVGSQNRPHWKQLHCWSWRRDE